MEQVHPKDALPQGVYRASPGALLAHPQHIAEQGAQGGRRQGHPRGGIAVPQVPAPADEAGPRQGEDHPQDTQDVDEKFRNAADGKVPQIPPGQVVAHIAQHHVDLEALQQDGERLIGVEGGPHGQRTGKEESQAQDVQNLPPAGRRGEPLNQGVDQVQADEGIQNPQMEIGVPLGRRHQGGPDAPQGEGPAPQQLGHHGVQAPPEHQHAEGG